MKPRIRERVFLERFQKAAWFVYFFLKLASQKGMFA